MVDVVVTNVKNDITQVNGITWRHSSGGQMFKNTGFKTEFDKAKVNENSGGAMYIMFENHVRSWPLLKTL